MAEGIKPTVPSLLPEGPLVLPELSTEHSDSSFAAAEEGYLNQSLAAALILLGCIIGVILLVVGFRLCNYTMRRLRTVNDTENRSPAGSATNTWSISKEAGMFGASIATEGIYEESHTLTYSDQVSNRIGERVIGSVISSVSSTSESLHSNCTDIRRSCPSKSTSEGQDTNLIVVDVEVYTHELNS